ncbi:MAG TPA: DNA polymerase III subunit delta [Bacillota bacterium]
MNRAEFIKQMNEGRLLQTYLLLGEEKLFQEELLGAALRKLVAEADREFNFLRLNAATVSPEDLLSNLETPAFFGSGARIISLEDFEKAAAGVDEAAVKGLTRLAGGVYFFISAVKLDGRKKLHQELQRRVLAVDCNKLRPADLPLWIKQRSEHMGLKLTSDQLRLIAERLGTDLLLVRTQLEKVSTFCGKASSITDDDLDRLITGTPEADIFGLIDAVSAKNPKLSLGKLETYLDSGENELKLLATLARQFRNITAALVAKEQRLTPRNLAERLGINPYVAEKSFSQAGRFDLEELHGILERLLRADYAIKTGQREPRLELELAVVEITSGTLIRPFPRMYE